jgi:hypothetical protein
VTINNEGATNMTSISGNMGGGEAANISGYQSQIADLQRQCADWRGCATTPASEKEKQISALQSQIQTLQHKIGKVDQVPSANAVYDVADKISQAQTMQADGVNRPDADPFAISGSVVNLKI